MTAPFAASSSIRRLLLICAVGFCQAPSRVVVGAGRVCARVPMLISVRDSDWLPVVGDMMVMGFPLGGSCGAAARSLEAVHADVAGSRMRGAGRGASADVGRGAHEGSHAGASAWSPSSLRVW